MAKRSIVAGERQIIMTMLTGSPGFLLSQSACFAVGQSQIFLQQQRYQSLQCLGWSWLCAVRCAVSDRLWCRGFLADAFSCQLGLNHGHQCEPSENYYRSSQYAYSHYNQHFVPKQRLTSKTQNIIRISFIFTVNYYCIWKCNQRLGYLFRNHIKGS